MPRLQQFSPPLPPDLVQDLQELGIKTDTDLLLTHDPLAVFSKLPPGHGISLKQFREILTQVTGIAAAAPTDGNKLLERETKRQEDIFADHSDLLLGVPDVDALLGGFSPPMLVELSGDTRSGKTGVALQVALRHLTRNQHASALWIDSSGEFSPERVAQLLDQLGGPYASTALERLQVSLAFDIEAVHDVLESVRQSFSAATATQASAHGPVASAAVTRCIVIDTITALLGPMLSATSSQGHAIMTTFMRQLRSYADAFCLTVIVVNGSTRIGPRNPDSKNAEAVFETDRKPALGPSFTFMTDATLWLSLRELREGESEDSDSTIHVAEVFRSRSTRSRTWAQFKITNGLLVSA
ncbi:P-loop containing nucleoside triphosphate hydrolase protein [Daedaleopsis nitida]|nr:P-loop containing nucleoside triphosphate hydrolase protein [Daedaleopsis nitida]